MGKNKKNKKRRQEEEKYLEREDQNIVIEVLPLTKGKPYIFHEVHTIPQWLFMLIVGNRPEHQSLKNIIPCLKVALKPFSLLKYLLIAW